MGYGVPAAVAMKRLHPERTVVAFAGDGDFLMTGQEFATAVQYGLPIIVLVVDNGMYGTIRMHQERDYPGRVVGTQLQNPDFAAYARAFGGFGATVERTADFAGSALPRFGQQGLVARQDRGRIADENSGTRAHPRRSTGAMRWRIRSVTRSRIDTVTMIISRMALTSV